MTTKLNKSLTNFYNYKGVKFEEYTIELKDNKIIGRPIIKHDTKINVVNNVDGLEILLSLCNLYNKYTYKESTNDDNLELGIKNWCNQHVHPANNNNLIRTIELFDYKKDNLSKRKQDVYIKELHEAIDKYVRFNVEEFKNQLERLTANFNMWYALDMACNHNNIDVLQVRINNGMIAPTTDLIDIINNSIKTKKRINNIKKIAWIILGEMTYFMPICKRKLSYLKENDTFEYLVYTDNIFDIALDVFGTLIKNTYNNYQYTHKIIVCENCDDYFIRTGSTQRYCDKKECQAVRNRNKVKAFNERNRM